MKRHSLFKLIGLSAFALTLLASAACSDAPPDPASNRPSISVYPFGADRDHPALGNHPTADSPIRDTGILVMSGDRIELKPSMLVRTMRNVVPPNVARESRPVCAHYVDVCVATEPIIQSQCERKCKLCESCNLFGCRPKVCCTSVCHDVHVGDRCVASQPQCSQQDDHWLETSSFPELGPDTVVQDTSPMKSTALLLAGLKLRFSWTGSDGFPQSTDCRLDQLKPAVDTDTLTWTVGPSGECPTIFADPGIQADLALINEMSEPVTYPFGRQLKTWDGSVLENPQDKTYLPPIDFVGTLTVFAGPSSF